MGRSDLMTEAKGEKWMPPQYFAYRCQWLRKKNDVGEMCKECLEVIRRRVSVSDKFESYLYDISSLTLALFIMNFILMCIVGAYI